MRKPRKVAKSPGILFVAALVALATAPLGCGGPAQQSAQAPDTVRGLRIETLRMESVPDEIEAPGSVVALATAQVAARAMGTVTEVAVREGDRVQRGQLLVQLDERELIARRDAARAALREAQASGEEAAQALTAAQAQADVARKTYERFVYLREQKSVSPQEFDEVEAKNRAAKAGLEQAQARQQQTRAMLARAQAEVLAAETVAGYARIVAPFDGVVLRRTVELGSMITPGTPLMVIEDSSRYRLEVAVEAADAARVRRGTRARVRLDALPGRDLEGTVAELEAGADTASHTVSARIDLPRNPAIRSGLFGRAWFARGQRRAIVVPRTAVVERGQLRGVYTVDAGQTARLRLVTLGQSFPSAGGERIEILSGLSEGDRIVAEPGDRELDGRKVETSR